MPKQWIFVSKPAGQVGPEHFELKNTPMPEPGEGEGLVRATHLSLDPASRAWMMVPTYRSQLTPGEVMAELGHRRSGEIEQ